MATLDFKNKQVKISEPYYLTANMEQDFDFFYAYFKDVVGKIPELS
jgi:hypothetical protein